MERAATRKPVRDNRQADIEEAITRSSRASGRVESIDELRKRIVIDRDNLDENVIEQPDLFYRVAEQVALAISRRDKLKLDLEQAQAVLDKKLRAKYEASDKKVTEKTISAEIESNAAILELRNDFVEAVAEVGRWNALKEAFDQRKDMLKVASQLYASQYFTRSSTSGARSNIVDTDAERVRQSAGSERRARMKE